MYENESSFPNLDEEEPCATTQLIVLGNINRGLAFATSIDVETIFRYPGNYGLYRRILDYLPRRLPLTMAMRCRINGLAYLESRLNITNRERGEQ